jgi:hypothetical protein
MIFFYVVLQVMLWASGFIHLHICSGLYTVHTLSYSILSWFLKVVCWLFFYVCRLFFAREIIDSFGCSRVIRIARSVFTKHTLLQIFSLGVLFPTIYNAIMAGMLPLSIFGRLLKCPNCNCSNHLFSCDNIDDVSIKGSILSS